MNYSTAYRYDPLGDLISVTQGSQTRSFTYDGLQRLTQVANPESGTVTYSYDNANNLLTRADNRSITASYTYDALNRLSAVSYSDSTPQASYSYDPNIPNGKGQLASVSNGNSITSYTGYDALGEILASTQATAGESYSFLYSYNLAGALLSETYPSGRVAAIGYDTANRPASLSGTYASTVTKYVQSAVYWPHGAPAFATYGNNVVPAWTYNSRLQPLSIYATDNNNANEYLWVQNYNWGMTNDNGTLLSGAEGYGASVPYSSLSWLNQSYSYDNVNRLTSVSDSGYTRSFGYDQWGNMWVTGNSGVTLAGNTPTSNVYSSANNQIGGMSYDAAGNALIVNGNTITYDAENRQTSATEPPAVGGGTVQYFYDGSGQRVEKLLDGNLTIYVYDALGQLAAEYQSGNAQTAPCHTCYLVQDHLGSTRLVTDDLGSVVARHDFLPFGEEVLGGSGGRNHDWGTVDFVDQKFTGQVRDSETNEDFFNARYFTGALGRFNSPDPGNAGADPTDPQTWNAYSYVRNNPLNATDPSGLDICSDGTWASVCVTDSAPPDLESVCWWCWEYGYPYTGGQRSAQPAQPQQKPQQPAQPPQPPNNGTNNNCVAGYGAAGAAAGAGVGWLGGGAAAVLGAETGPADIAIAYGGKVLSSAVGTYVGQQAGQLIGSIVCSSSTGAGRPQEARKSC